MSQASRTDIKVIGPIFDNTPLILAFKSSDNFYYPILRNTSDGDGKYDALESGYTIYQKVDTDTSSSGYVGDFFKVSYDVDGVSFTIQAYTDLDFKNKSQPNNYLNLINISAGNGYIVLGGDPTKFKFSSRSEQYPQDNILLHAGIPGRLGSVDGNGVKMNFYYKLNTTSISDPTNFSGLPCGVDTVNNTKRMSNPTILFLPARWYNRSGIPVSLLPLHYCPYTTITNTNFYRNVCTNYSPLTSGYTSKDDLLNVNGIIFYYPTTETGKCGNKATSFTDTIDNTVSINSVYGPTKNVDDICQYSFVFPNLNGTFKQVAPSEVVEKDICELGDVSNCQNISTLCAPYCPQCEVCKTCEDCPTCPSCSSCCAKCENSTDNTNNQNNDDSSSFIFYVIIAILSTLLLISVSVGVYTWLQKENGDIKDEEESDTSNNIQLAYI
jgi:hypothetical protein